MTEDEIAAQGPFRQETAGRRTPSDRIPLQAGPISSPHSLSACGTGSVALELVQRRDDPAAGLGRAKELDWTDPASATGAHVDDEPGRDQSRDSDRQCLTKPWDSV